MLYPRTGYLLRTDDSINDAAIPAKVECSIVDGIKGKSVLSQVVDLPVGAPIDYMHCVLEGVILLNLATTCNIVHDLGKNFH